MTVSVLVVTGEASGDLHAADLVGALKRHRPDLTFFGMGGPKLEAQGVELVHSAQEISVMGIAEVLPKIPRILTVLGDLVAQAQARRPACAILVDVPDFNFRLAKRLKLLGIRVVWYISPTVWAWREGRTKLLARYVDHLLCILPFEEAFLRERGVKATYVGSPLLDQVPQQASAGHFRQSLGLLEHAPVLALLPGSRRSEISRILPTLVEVAKRVQAQRPTVQIVVPVAPSLPASDLRRPFEQEGVNPVMIDGRAPEVVGASDVAVVASGTATLEAGLMRRPLVAVYRVNLLTYVIGKMMVRAKFFCLVNLLANERVVPELLQGELTCEAVMAELDGLWAGPKRDAMMAGLDRVRATLGEGGASERAAQIVLGYL
jgi:lipid-A-disaccharide synthase